ncbi:unnamed protein product, partial [Trichobilharzia szidati]
FWWPLNFFRRYFLHHSCSRYTNRGTAMNFVKEIVSWHDPIKSGIVAAVGLTSLLSLSCMSLISFIAYAGMSLICCTAAWKFYNVITLPFKSNSSKDPF